MVKLSSVQVSALANKIYNQISDANKDFNNIAIESNNKITEKYINRSSILKDMLIWDNNIRHKFGTYFQIKYPNEYIKTKNTSYNLQNEIRDEIVIATIEAEDIEGLIAQVKAKFV